MFTQTNTRSITNLTLSRSFLALITVVATLTAATVVTNVSALEVPSQPLTYIRDEQAYSFDFTTRAHTLLAERPADSVPGALSPDGRLLARWQPTPGSRQLTLMISDTATQAVIAAHSINSYGDTLAWTSDGEHLLVSAWLPETANRTADLWLVHYVTGTMQALTQTNAAELNARFSPDGTQLVYTRLENGQRRLHIMDMTTRNSYMVADREADRAAWSGDGRWIAFESSVDGVTSHIWIVNANGTSLQPVTDGDVYDHSAAWDV
jgi:hypothetical protein